MMPLKDLDGRIPFRRRRGLPPGRGAWSLGAREKGATVPTGQTEFQFKAGALNFKSAAYEGLPVSGSRVQYKGTGTVNGAGTTASSSPRSTGPSPAAGARTSCG